MGPTEVCGGSAGSRSKRGCCSPCFSRTSSQGRQRWRRRWRWARAGGYLREGQEKRDAPLVGARTLIIKAARDNVIPHERSDRLIEAWPGQPRIATLAGTDHNFIFTSEFYDLVGEFLAGR